MLTQQRDVSSLPYHTIIDIYLFWIYDAIKTEFCTQISVQLLWIFLRVRVSALYIEDQPLMKHWHYIRSKLASYVKSGIPLDVNEFEPPGMATIFFSDIQSNTLNYHTPCVFCLSSFVFRLPSDTLSHLYPRCKAGKLLHVRLPRAACQRPSRAKFYSYLCLQILLF